MRRPRSATGLRERAAALTHPWWRSTGRAEASSLAWGSDRHQGRRPASRNAAAVSSAFWPNSCGPRQLVGRVAAKRNEVRNLLWIDAVALPDLFGPDAGHFAGPYRVQDLCAVRGKLERIPIAARDQDGSAFAFLGGNHGGEKVVRLEAAGFRVRKPARRHELGQQLQLLDQGVVKLTAALIGRKLLVAFCGRL